MPANFKTRLFLILFVAGVAGVLSFLLVDLEALVALFPVKDGTQPPTISTTLKLLSLIQPTILIAVAVLVGVVLAPRVGLSSPFAEALAARAPSIPALRSQLVPGVIGGLVGGISIVATAAALKPFMTSEALRRISSLGELLPLPTRFLYGGIVEELLLRWGLMTLLVWIAWRLFQKRRSEPANIWFIAAIVISAVVFAVGHLPVVILLVGQPTVPIILFVIVANSAFGIVAGYLYWKYGLESAMIGHMLCHIVLVTASYAGAYF
jgi:hypothetical protein